MQGLVGFKATARLVPTGGTVPLSPTLDTACAITRSVRDAVLLHAVLADRPVAERDVPAHRLRLAVPSNVMLDGLEPAVAAAFERSLARLRAAGACVEEIALPALGELRSLNAQGGFPPRRPGIGTGTGFSAARPPMIPGWRPASGAAKPSGRPTTCS